MNKRTFIGSLPCFGLSCLVKAEDKQRQAHSDLSPEACSMQSPDAMWSLRVAANPLESSEQAQTRFYQAYETKLRQWTDAKYPKAKTVRPNIQKAFSSAMELIVLDVWGGVAHVLTRLPAEIEWCVWQGFAKQFEEAYVGRYQHQTITDLLVAIFEANADVDKKLADSRWRINDCVAALTEAEKQMPEQGAYFFRSHLLKRIAQCV